MKVYLVHHATTLTVEQDPERHLAPQGRDEADRLGRRFKAEGADPVRILHSERQWVRETAERIAAIAGLEDRLATAEYPIFTNDPLAPFIAEIGAAGGDLMMVGHVDYLLRSASKLVCGDEGVSVVAFKPGFATAFCIEGDGADWVLTSGWRQANAPG